MANKKFTFSLKSVSIDNRGFTTLVLENNTPPLVSMTEFSDLGSLGTVEIKVPILEALKEPEK